MVTFRNRLVASSPLFREAIKAPLGGAGLGPLLAATGGGGPGGGGPGGGGGPDYQNVYFEIFNY